jgi:DTW domain-containing protein YfiP
LRRCHCLVLQHPHEERRKNRSLPLAELCLHPDSLTVVRGRRFGPEATPANTEASLQRLLLVRNEKGSSAAVWLLFPGPSAISLQEALQRRRRRKGSKEEEDEVVTLVFLDATWRYAREMDSANVRHGQYPANTLRVQVTAGDGLVVDSRRFDIRAPPAELHFSTAECLAFVASKVEGRSSGVYDTLMKPLDLMVKQWHSFSDKKSRNEKRVSAKDPEEETGSKEQADSLANKRPGN